MAKKHITLTYDPSKPDAPWLMSTNPVKPPKPKGEYDVLYAVKGEKADFYFKIATEGIQFDPGNPIQIRAVDSKNQGGAAQFKAKANGNQLVVENPNEDLVPTDYYYQLNFVGKPSLDPIIQNGCCKSPIASGGNMSLFSETSAIGAILVAAAVIALFVTRLGRVRT